MALTATVYNFSLALNDSEREVFESLDLRLACHPSETQAFMLTRLLAYCLEYAEGIVFTGGVSSGDQCAVQVIDLTGRITHWIEVGLPPAERLHRGSKLAGRASLYSHHASDKVLSKLRGKSIHGADAIPLITFTPGFIEALVPTVQRRNSWSLSVTGDQLYLDIDGQSVDTPILRRMIEG